MYHVFFEVSICVPTLSLEVYNTNASSLYSSEDCDTDKDCKIREHCTEKEYCEWCWGFGVLWGLVMNHWYTSDTCSQRPGRFG